MDSTEHLLFSDSSSKNVIPIKSSQKSTLSGSELKSAECLKHTKCKSKEDFKEILKHSEGDCEEVSTGILKSSEGEFNEELTGKSKHIEYENNEDRYENGEDLTEIVEHIERESTRDLTEISEYSECTKDLTEYLKYSEIESQEDVTTELSECECPENFTDSFTNTETEFQDDLIKYLKHTECECNENLTDNLKASESQTTGDIQEILSPGVRNVNLSRNIFIRYDPDGNEANRANSNKKTTFETIDVDDDSTICELKSCLQYSNVIEFAEGFIDNVIYEAIKKIEQNVSNILFVRGFSNSSFYPFVWPTIEDFSIEIGILAIEEYVAFWNVKENWKFVINFLNIDSGDAIDLYKYECIFSLPCKQYPIPQATAAVFFTIQITRGKPASCPVDVFYKFEGHRLIHVPEQYGFHEEWLLNILRTKLRLYGSIEF